MTQCPVSSPATTREGVGGNPPVTRGPFANSAFARLPILERYRRIAMVGLSSNPFRPSHFAAIYLLAEGYHVVPANPLEPQVLGLKCYPSRQAIPPPIPLVHTSPKPPTAPSTPNHAPPTAPT